MPIEYESCNSCHNAGSCEDYEPDHPHRCRLVTCDSCGEYEDDIDGDMYELEDGSVVCSRCLMRYLTEHGIIRTTMAKCSRPDACLDCPSDGSYFTHRRWYVNSTKERVCDEEIMDYLEEIGTIKYLK